MLYAAMTFWLMVIVLAAWAVHEIWSSLVRPKVVNSILLPGTLAAQVGHVIGLLVTGATITGTSLVKDDETGEPATTEDPNPRIPIVGTIIIALLPLVACAAGVFVVADFLGGGRIEKLAPHPVTQTLPQSLQAFWQQLRDAITLMEDFVNGVLESNLRDWHTFLFFYLAIALTVRMAPFPGNLRGSLGAILLFGLAAALFGAITQVTDDTIQKSWQVLTFSVASLLVLLFISLMVFGVVRGIKLLSGKR